MDAPARTCPLLAHLADDMPDHAAARAIRAGRVTVDGAVTTEPRTLVPLEALVEVAP